MNEKIKIHNNINLKILLSKIALSIALVSGVIILEKEPAFLLKYKLRRLVLFLLIFIFGLLENCIMLLSLILPLVRPILMVIL